uniref:Rubredoxin-like domain-containing protein n=1 Tax=Ditylum brightwellii TaxID=49249 RepID=A0A6S9B882_9STRA|mmetsp:Transcript_35836/g.53408  ORF Transcript_35836/g.53408 Transcript_35836/m.53408 type:complete len:152 (-) Transcript_35836:225-680(-)
MKSIFAILSLLLVCLTASTSAFAPSGRTTALMPRTSVAPATTTSLNVFGKKKTAEQKAIEEEKAAKFWQGEWVCKDCGYIYQRAECAGMYFEEQGAGFRCPQCSGPRRRYAKKVGDVVGTTLDGGDAPILIFSFGGVIATIAFGIWAVENL